MRKRLLPQKGTCVIWRNYEWWWDEIKWKVHRGNTGNTGRRGWEGNRGTRVGNSSKACHSISTSNRASVIWWRSNQPPAGSADCVSNGTQPIPIKFLEFWHYNEPQQYFPMAVLPPPSSIPQREQVEQLPPPTVFPSFVWWWWSCDGSQDRWSPSSALSVHLPDVSITHCHPNISISPG